MTIQTMTGNSGGAVPVDFFANIKVFGANGVEFQGNPGTNTLTSLFSNATDTQKGGAKYSTEDFVVAAANITLKNQTGVAYLGKHGSDAYDGANIESSRLTLTSFLTLTSTTRAGVCLDRGSYTGNVVPPASTPIFLPNIIYDGRIFTNASGYITLGKVTPTTTPASSAALVTANSTWYHIDWGEVTTAGISIVLGSLGSPGELIYGKASANTNAYSGSSLFIILNYCDLVGAADCFDLSGAAILRGSCCFDDGAGRFFNTTAAASYSLYCNIDVDTLSNMAADRLYLVAARSSGSQTGAGKVRELSASGINYVTVGPNSPDLGAFSHIEGAYLNKIAGWSGTENTWNQAGVQTIGSTVTDLIQIPVADSQMVTIEARINGLQSTYAKGISARVFATFRRGSGGNVTVVGTPSITTHTDSGSLAVAVTADTGAQEATITVQGIAAETYNWVGTYIYTYLVDNT